MEPTSGGQTGLSRRQHREGGTKTLKLPPILGVPCITITGQMAHDQGQVHAGKCCARAAR